ncbi:MAG: PBP1A family penicillin-binding protein [Desulfomonilaceae bacterium]|nr:PBP1A family penicillin-binding protein [Desulfomonilaceae bacterium]
MKPSSYGGRNNSNPYWDMHEQVESGRKRWSLFNGFARLLLLMGFGCVAGLAGVAAQSYLFFIKDLPDIDKLKNYAPPIVTRVYANKGELIEELAEERRFVVPFEQIPKMLQDAYVAAEDKNFWTHPGVDKEAVLRAVVETLKRGRIGPGASTITQQVARAFLLSREKKIFRKIREMILARRIDASMTKEHILYLYLNHIFLGSRAYGVEAAARTYFNKHVQDLSIAECAMLGGLAQRPGRNSPDKNYEGALKRAHYVLRRMQEDGYITEAQYDEAIEERPEIVTTENPNSKIAPGFVEHVRKYIVKKYGETALYKGGLQVYTTVDLELTKAARAAMEVGLEELTKRQGYRGPLQTLNVKGVMEFLQDKTESMKAPLRFGDVTDGVITHIDDESIDVRMGSYVRDGVKREYVGQIKIDPNSDWWVRTPFTRPELRTRNFAKGDLPFQVGDLIMVRIVDPNTKRRELYLKKYGNQDPEMKNYKVYTEDMMRHFILDPVQHPVAQAALMMRENRSGYVRVMLGGYSYQESEYNRAVQSRRQAGSSFKPVIYAAALNKGFTCADIIMDSPLELTVPGTGEVWRPKNYRGGFQGPVTFRNALVHSRNIPTIKVLQQIGLEHAKAYARKLGYESPLVNNLTLALGSTGVSLEEQLNAYSVFPNRGYLVPNVYVTKIVDRNGKILEQNDPPILLDDPVDEGGPRIQTVAHEASAESFLDPDERNPSSRRAIPARRRIDEGTAYIMTTLLQGVVREGTATILKKIVGRPDIAGKTGTTNDNIDAWFMGFTPGYTAGVWVGFDEEVSLGAGETGGKAAVPIWGLFIKKLLQDKPVEEFAEPPSVERRMIDPRTGLVASSDQGVEEVFKQGSGPSHERPTPVRGSRWDYAGSDLDQF